MAGSRELMQKLLAEQLQGGNRNFVSPWAGLGKIATALALAKQNKKVDADSQSQKAQLAAALGDMQAQSAMGGGTGMFRDPAARQAQGAENLVRAGVDPLEAVKIKKALEPEKPKPVKYGVQEIKVGENIETYLTENGKPTMPLAEAPRSVVQQIEQTNRNFDMTEGSKTASQKSLTDLQILRKQLNTIDETDADEFLTWSGKMKRASAIVLNKIGAGSLKFGEGETVSEFLGRNQDFVSQTEHIFAGLRKQITGAQAAFVELEFLRDTLLSTDMAPDQYKASLNRFKTFVNQSISIHEKLLRDGYEVGTIEYGDKFDDAYFEKLSGMTDKELKELPAGVRRELIKRAEELGK